MAEGPKQISVLDHGRGIRMIRRGKAWGGLGGFALAALASVTNGAVVFDTLLRGLIAGAVGYLLGWAAAVLAAQHVVRADVRSAVEAAAEERRRRSAASANGAS